MFRLRSYVRILVENLQFRSDWGRLTQKFQVEGVASTNHSSQKTRLNDLSYYIWSRHLKDTSKNMHCLAFSDHPVSRILVSFWTHVKYWHIVLYCTGYVTVINLICFYQSRSVSYISYRPTYSICFKIFCKMMQTFTHPTNDWYLLCK